MSHKLGDKVEVCRNQVSKVNKMCVQNKKKKEWNIPTGEKIQQLQQQQNSENWEIKVTATSKPENVQPS